MKQFNKKNKMGQDDEDFNWTEEDQKKSMTIFYGGVVFVIGWILFLLYSIGVLSF